MNKKTKVAYVTTYDSSNINAWSGTGNRILKTLQSVGYETENIGNLRENNIWSVLSKLKKLYFLKVIQKKYIRDRVPGILRGYASQVEQALALSNCDIIFSPGTIPIAYLKTEKPIVFWTDATFAGMIDFYPEFSNLCDETLINGNKIEQLALSKCRLAIYSSEWAANTAIQNYNVDPTKVKVVPFGANIDCDRNSEDIDKIVELKNFDVCKLLFLGVDWHRKGGDKALEIANFLNNKGIRTELHIVGCTPPIPLPPFVKNHGYISKKTQDGREYIDNLFSSSHFLILPSKADCTPVVFAEASSFGLPSLSTKVGGISTIIRDGKNGWTFNLDDPIEAYCDRIENAMSSKSNYKALAFSCFNEYSERLNWHSAGKELHNLIETHCF